ncbi:MAG: nicotinate (nicotinamide) nucleotide adenylyltransferase [Candidatus Cyclobacteriaceae bacterium M3_2C_046]
MKIGLYFGSFNPIHNGHLIVANILVETTDLQEVWFVISPRNPFKSSSTLLHEFDRLHMVRLAIEDNYHFKATDVEFQMPRPSYTIDTLVYLQEKHPHHQFKLIMGSDNMKFFPKWKNSEVILNQFGLYIYPRPGAHPNDSDQTILLKHPHVKVFEAPLLDISATFIRQCIQKERSIRYLVPDSVTDFIQSKKLYQ